MNVTDKWPVIYLFAGPLWAICIAVFVILPMARLERDKVMACTSVSQATVVAYDQANHSSGVFQYNVDGVTYTSHQAGMSSSDVGTKLTVHYNPKNPAQEYSGEEDHFSWAGWFTGMTAFILAVTVVMILAYFDARKKLNRVPISI